VTRERRLLALGDSYTIGEAVDEGERWPVRLVALLRARGISIADPVIVAKTGWTTDELSAGIDGATLDATYDVVTLLIGVNDQYRGRSALEYREQFGALFDRAVALAGDRVNHVVVLSIPDWGVTPFAAGRDRRAIAAEIDAFNAINRQESVGRGAQYVDVTPVSRMAAADSSLIAHDGLHPSGAMYGRWADLAAPALSKVLGRT
jgi:lysophospholipase L1-like esterase